MSLYKAQHDQYLCGEIIKLTMPVLSSKWLTRCRILKRVTPTSTRTQGLEALPNISQILAMMESSTSASTVGWDSNL